MQQSLFDQPLTFNKPVKEPLKMDTNEHKLNEIEELRKSFENFKIQQNQKNSDFDLEMKKISIRQKIHFAYLKSQQENIQKSLSSDGSVAGSAHNEDLQMENQKLIRQNEELRKKLEETDKLNVNLLRENESLKKQLEESEDEITYLQEINEWLKQQADKTNLPAIKEVKLREETHSEEKLKVVCEKFLVQAKNSAVSPESEIVFYDKQNLLEAMRKSEEVLEKIDFEKQAKNQEIRKIDPELKRLAQKRLDELEILRNLQERETLTKEFLKTVKLADGGNYTNAIKEQMNEKRLVEKKLNEIRIASSGLTKKKTDLIASIKQLEMNFNQKSSTYQRLKEQIIKISKKQMTEKSNLKEKNN